MPFAEIVMFWPNCGCPEAPSFPNPPPNDLAGRMGLLRNTKHWHLLSREHWHFLPSHLQLHKQGPLQLMQSYSKGEVAGDRDGRCSHLYSPSYLSPQRTSGMLMGSDRGLVWEAGPASLFFEFPHLNV